MHQEPLHRRVLAPIIRAKVAKIRREDRRLKKAILADKNPSPLARSLLANIQAREEKRFLESLGLSTPSGVEIVRHSARQSLIDEAIARGCNYYGAFGSKAHRQPNLRDVSTEVLAAALLSGEMPEACDAVRIGAMLISTPNLDLDQVVRAAEEFGVLSRLRHIVDLAVTVDKDPRWRELSSMLPWTAPEPDMPGISRFTSETRFPVAQRIWLKPKRP